MQLVRPPSSRRPRGPQRSTVGPLIAGLLFALALATFSPAALAQDSDTRDGYPLPAAWQGEATVGADELASVAPRCRLWTPAAISASPICPAKTAM